MKLLFAAMAVLGGAVLLALLLLEDPGYVLISYDVWTLETSLSFFVLALVLGYLLIYVLGRSLTGAWRLPGRVRGWRRRRQRERARTALHHGMLALAEGHWKQAERRLVRRAGQSDVALLNYLGAARAAQQQGAIERRDHYLHLAHESSRDADLAVALTQAELQVARNQLEQALATLTQLRTREPTNTYVLQLLVRIYRELKDWSHLRDLLPDLRRQQVYAPDEQRALEQRVYRELLHRAAVRKDLKALHATWEQVPRSLRDDEALMMEYAGHLVELGHSAEAEPLLRTAIRRRWNDQLVHLYGLVEGEDAARQLATAEEWAKEHGKNPVLLLTLGRLSLRNRLWGKARAYLESSIGAGAKAETYKELGALLERMGDESAARECYREGLALAVQQSTHHFPEDVDLRGDADAQRARA